MTSFETHLGAAKHLIRQRRYGEARALLQSIDHPTARRWLAQLDRVVPSQPAPRLRLLPWLAAAVLAFAVIVGVGYTLVARFFPASIPLANAANCAAQEWYDQVSGRVPMLALDLGFSQNDTAATSRTLATLRKQRGIIETITYPNCVQRARASLLNSLDEDILALQYADTVDLYGHLLNALTSLKDTFAQLGAFGVHLSAADASLAAGLSGECPARLWVLQNVFVGNDFMQLFLKEGYLRGLVGHDDALQAQIFQLSNARRALQNTPPPPCLAKAKTYMLGAMDSGVATLDAVRGHDPNGVSLHQRSMTEQFLKFADQLQLIGVDVSA
jgi:hypothetical protein